jgi:HAD superfamily hydrolase (TIGR01509 family)
MIGTNVAAGQRVVGSAELDAVTIDAFGTLLELRNPAASLARELPGYGREAIDRAFRAEAAYYAERSHLGRDAESLSRLRDDCAKVFNAELGSSLSGEEYVAALEFEWVEGALEAIERLRRRGLALAVVSNWDISLVERLAPLGIAVVTSAEAGAPKPDPAAFRLALDRLGVASERTLHVGDGESDALDAAAAGVLFAEAPLADVDREWS